MIQPGRQYTAESYRYGFQNQETDPETGLLNFKYRMHDPRIARFFTTDPLEAKYSYNSPYAFQENKMGLGVELEGLELALSPIYSEAFTRAIPDDQEIRKQVAIVGVMSAGGVVAIELGGVAWTSLRNTPLLYNPELYNETGAFIWGMGTDEEWPLPSVSGNGTRLLKGLRARWIERFGEVLANVEIHHIIPNALRNHKVIKRAGLDINELFNAIPLDKYSVKRNLEDGLHANHPQYNTYVQNQLDDIDNLGPLSQQALIEEVSSLRKNLVTLIDDAKSKGVRLNEYFRELNNSTTTTP